MAAVKDASSKACKMFLGYCLPSLKYNASKFRVQVMELDKKLLMFFKKNFDVYAYDPNKICKTGDIVLIKELEQKKSSLITYEVLEIVYPCGDITDPITGKKVAGFKYRHEEEAIINAFGKAESAFVYDAAPERGWQEGRKDFTHRKAYRKFHEFEKGDENEKQPFAKD